MLIRDILRYHRSVPGRLFGRWLSYRIPASRRSVLSQKNIFIFPSRFGLAFLALGCCLYLLGSNYENNLIQLISFLMVSMLFKAIFFSFRNFSSTVVEGLVPPVGQVSVELLFPVRITSNQHILGLHLGFVSGPPIEPCMQQADGGVVGVPLIPQQRGWLYPGRLLLQSSYPMGLIRCWTYLDCAAPALIYPTPLKCKYTLRPSPQGQNSGVAAKQATEGMDEFSHLKEYQIGESLRQVAWKQLAQGRGMLSKSFTDAGREAVWLGFDSVSGSLLETKISELAFAVYALGQHGHVFGLLLGKEEVGPACGAGHIHDCLKALALYGKKNNE